MIRLGVGITAAAVALGASASAQAQDSGATMFNRGDFSGPSYTLVGPTQQIDPALTVRSIKIAPGEEWEFCSGNTFSGCKLVTQSTRGIVMNVRSARPARVAQAAAAAAAAAAAVYAGTGAGPSLRGVVSEFFVVPEQDGRRVGVAADGAAAQADAFCRSRGWASAAHETSQAVDGATYLADVLCVAAQ